jgi:CheY-specific phosphatase CheX
VTSSARLRRVPDAAEHYDGVRAALVDVAEHSFFAFVDAVEPDTAGEFSADVGSWLMATVVFSGAFGGTLRVALAEPLARELFDAFLGLDPGATADEAPLFDLVGEFGNMVCGSWLTRSCQRRRFDLAHPAVERAAAVDARFDWAHALPLAINGQPAWLHLEFAEA